MGLWGNRKLQGAMGVTPRKWRRRGRMNAALQARSPFRLAGSRPSRAPARRVPPCGDRRDGIGRGRFAHFERERVANRHAAVVGSILQVFRQQERAALQLRRRDDQAVPPNETVSLLDFSATLHNRFINRLRSPREECARIIPGFNGGDAGLELARQGDVVLGEYLGARSAALLAPQEFQPRGGTRLLSR